MEARPDSSGPDLDGDRERTQAEVKRIDLVLRERSASFVENYRTAKIMVDRYRTEILPRAQRAYELLYKRYGLLQASYPQVLLSEHTLFKAETDYIQNLETLWANSLALKAAASVVGSTPRSFNGALPRSH